MKFEDLKELELLNERLSLLLKDKQPGLMTWQFALWDIIDQMKKLI
mgnify:CR=1 FL=1